MGVRDPLLEPPGRDHFIADIAVDFAARRDYRFSEIDDETVEQPVKCECAEALGESRRPLHVDEQEHARFNSRPVMKLSSTFCPSSLLTSYMKVNTNEAANENSRSWRRMPCSIGVGNAHAPRARPNRITTR